MYGIIRVSDQGVMLYETVEYDNGFTLEHARERVEQMNMKGYQDELPRCFIVKLVPTEYWCHKEENFIAVFGTFNKFEQALAKRMKDTTQTYRAYRGES